MALNRRCEPILSTRRLSLPRNPVPEPDLASAERHELALQGGMMSGMGGMMGGGMREVTGGMMGGGMMGGMMKGMGRNDGHGRRRGMVDQWHVHDRRRPGWHAAAAHASSAGAASCSRCATRPPGWHPMHLHGHSFRVLKRNGSPVPYRQWADTVLVSPQETVDVAFVADNPGDWMLHCHVMDHQTAGLMTVLRVA